MLSCICLVFVLYNRIFTERVVVIFLKSENEIDVTFVSTKKGTNHFIILNNYLIVKKSSRSEVILFFMYFC